MLIADPQKTEPKRAKIKEKWLASTFSSSEKKGTGSRRARPTDASVCRLPTRCMSVCGRVLPVRMSVGRLYYEPHTVMEYD
jgi:hypothetical protein